MEHPDEPRRRLSFIGIGASDGKYSAAESEEALEALGFGRDDDVAEDQADEDIAQGRVATFDTAEELFDDLNDDHHL